MEPKLLKKQTITDNLLTKQKKYIVIAVLAIVTLFFGSSYALLTNFKKSEEIIQISAGNLAMSITNTTVSLGGLPVSDSAGLATNPIVVTLQNTGTMNIMKYEVKILGDNTSTIGNQYVKYVVSTDNGTTYSEPTKLSEVNDIIFTGYNLGINGTKVLYIKAWISDDAGNNVVNKTFNGSITVELYQKGLIYDEVKKGAINDSNIDGNGTPIHFYEVNGTDNGNGKFIRSTTTSDTYPIYYYRGNVNNNNVIFANKCWKIVRTTETGGTKMIYNGDPELVYEGLEQSSFTIVTNTGGWTYDSTDNTWNITITNSGQKEISFNVPAGNGYTLVMTGTTGLSTGGSYFFYKDGTQLYVNSGGGGQSLAYTYSYGALTGDNVIKFTFSGSGTVASPVTFKLKMTNSSSELLGPKCDNSAESSLIATQKWNPNSSSPAYVGYNYGTTAYESSTEDWLSDVKFGSSYTWNGTSYTLVGATVTTPDETHHYSCNETDANASCSSLRYVYYKYQDTKYYITLQNGKGVEDALKEMLSESSDIIKSPIHETINAWYNNNIKTTYGKYVEDTQWCNDRSVSSDNLGGWKANGGDIDSELRFDVWGRFVNISNRSLNVVPVLTCPNSNDIMSVANGKLENPIALLTSDEANLAGFTYSSTDNSNYLISGKYYWLLSPCMFDYRYGAEVNIEYSAVTGEYAYASYTNEARGVRPALSLKHETTFYRGDGSIENPYIIVGTTIS